MAFRSPTSRGLVLHVWPGCDDCAPSGWASGSVSEAECAGCKGRPSEVACPGASGARVDVLCCLMGAIERTCFWVRPRLRARLCASASENEKTFIPYRTVSKKTTPRWYPVYCAGPQAGHRAGRVMEYVSLEGLRLDGRRPKETRRMRCELTALPGSDGSAVFELGNTKVLAAVHGPHECRRPSERLEDRLLVKCEVSMAAFSTGERRRRTKGDRRTNELSTFVRRCIETCVSAELLARSQLDVSIQVLQADGGVRAAAVNAAVLAIVDAGIPMQDTMACCSAGYLDDTPLLDLNYMEVRDPSSPQMPRQIP